MDCKNCVLFKHNCEGKMTIRRQEKQSSPLKFLLSHPDPAFYVSEDFNSTTKQIFDRWTEEIKGDVVFTKQCVQAKHITSVIDDRKARASCEDTMMEDLKGAKVIVACGNWALEALGYSRTHSSSVGWVDFNEELGASVLACRDPLEVEEVPGLFWKDFVWTVQRAEAIALGKAPIKNECPPLPWTKVTSLRRLEKLTASIPDGDIVGSDIETGGFLFYDEDKQITQIGLFHPKVGALIIPPAVFLFKGFGKWLEIFSNRVKLVFHNSKFDSKFIESKLTTCTTLGVDTIWLHQLIDERTGTHYLERLVRIYLNWSEYWTPLKDYPTPKNEGYRWVPFNVSAQYLAYDCYGTYLLAHKFLEELRDDTGRTDLPWPVLMSQRQHAEKVLVPVNNVLKNVEREGIRFDAHRVEQLIAETEPLVARMKEDIEDKVFDLIQEQVDINSPVQLLPALKKANILPKDANSVDKEAIENNLSAHPLMEELLTYRKDSKVLSTYYKGMQQRMVETSPGIWRVFPRFSMVGTIGSRWSSTNPNFQNSPRQGPFKTLFLPDEGHIIVSNDYSGLEARCAAWLSRDKKLAAACEADLHQTVADKAFAKFYSEIDPLDTYAELLDYTRSHPMLLSVEDSLQELLRNEKPFKDGKQKLKDHLRSCAKAITFGIFFGRGPKALAEKELMCSIGEAQQFIDDYFILFPDLHRWICEVKMLVRKEGIIICPDGRIRDLRGWLFSPSLMTRKRALARAERQAVNILTQGLAGTINNIAFARTDAYLREREIGKCLGAVHDSSVAQILLSKDFEETNRHLVALNEIGEKVFTTDIISFKVDSETGFNLGQVKKRVKFFEALKNGEYAEELSNFKFVA